MAVDTLNPKLGAVQPAGNAGQGATANPGVGSAQAAEFRSALDQAKAGFTTGAGAQAPLKGVGPKTALGTQALDALKASALGGPSATSLKFSTHAVERMRSRGISYAPEMMKSIETAVQKAAAKGSKDTLVLTDDSALIVSVKNNTVVTVMDRNAMKENVFTNIDSTVMV